LIYNCKYLSLKSTEYMYICQIIKDVPIKAGWYVYYLGLKCLYKFGYKSHRHSCYGNWRKAI